MSLPMTYKASQVWNYFHSIDLISEKLFFKSNSIIHEVCILHKSFFYFYSHHQKGTQSVQRALVDFLVGSSVFETHSGFKKDSYKKRHLLHKQKRS